MNAKSTDKSYEKSSSPFREITELLSKIKKITEEMEAEKISPYIIMNSEGNLSIQLNFNQTPGHPYVGLPTYCITLHKEDLLITIDELISQITEPIKTYMEAWLIKKEEIQKEEDHEH